jgi:hypothetical protein
MSEITIRDSVFGVRLCGYRKSCMGVAIGYILVADGMSISTCVICFGIARDKGLNVRLDSEPVREEVIRACEQCAEPVSVNVGGVNMQGWGCSRCGHFNAGVWSGAGGTEYLVRRSLIEASKAGEIESPAR